MWRKLFLVSVFQVFAMTANATGDIKIAEYLPPEDKRQIGEHLSSPVCSQWLQNSPFEDVIGALIRTVPYDLSKPSAGYDIVVDWSQLNAPGCGCGINKCHLAIYKFYNGKWRRALNEEVSHHSYSYNTNGRLIGIRIWQFEKSILPIQLEWKNNSWWKRN